MRAHRVHDLLFRDPVFLTAPVVSMMLARAAVYRDLRSRKRNLEAVTGEVYRLPEEE
jgi:multicomponent K+:H+ antiporter subunit G